MEEEAVSPDDTIDVGTVDVVDGGIVDKASSPAGMLGLHPSRGFNPCLLSIVVKTNEMQKSAK